MEGVCARCGSGTSKLKIVEWHRGESKLCHNCRDELDLTDQERV